MDKANDTPATLGEFVRLGWVLRTSCIACDVANVYEMDLASAVRTWGADYPLDQFTLAVRCKRCGGRLGFLRQSPEDQVSTRALMKLVGEATWGKSRRRPG